MRKPNFGPCITSPYLYALAGMPLPPLNILAAMIFWIWSQTRRPAVRLEAARCLNTQLTYSVLAYFPVAIAYLISSTALLEGRTNHLLFWRLVTGFPLGMLSLLGVIMLAVFNVRSFAHRALSLPHPHVPRVKLVREA